MTFTARFKPVFCKFFTKTAFLSPFGDVLKLYHPLTRDTMATGHISTLKRFSSPFLAQTSPRPNISTLLFITC